MSLGLIDRERFPREARGWLLRALACAAPSAVWAVGAASRTSALDLAGIATGVFLVALCFAVGCSLRAARSTGPRRRTVDALRHAAWLKAGWGVLGFGAYMDMLTGSWCLSFLGDQLHLRLADSPYVATLVVTLAQGVVIALELLILTAVVLGMREPLRRRGGRQAAVEAAAS